MKSQLGLLVLAAAILCAALVYACAARYSFHVVDQYHIYVFDHWTGRGEVR